MSKSLANFHFGVNYPFKDLKLQFTSVTILTPPDPEKLFIVEVEELRQELRQCRLI